MRSAAAALFAFVIVACSAVHGEPAAPTPRDARVERAATSTSTTRTTNANLPSEDDTDEADEPAAPSSAADRCPSGMTLVGGSFCIDKYEASLVEVLPDGTEKDHPYYEPVDGHVVRAVSRPGVYPQGYISEVQAEDACSASGKRLCSYPEWKTACMGPAKTTFPYGDARRAGVCHDTGKSAVVAVFGAKAVAASPVSPIIAAANAPKSKNGAKKLRPAHVVVKGKAAHTTKRRATRGTKTTKKLARTSVRPSGVDFNVWTKLNDARLAQVDGALAKTGEHPDCANEWGVVDMVGNLHEWVATDPNAPHGTFAGGYYLDTSQNGDGCNYKTQAHAHDYHDYSTGFRCCADAKP